MVWNYTLSLREFFFFFNKHFILQKLSQNNNNGADIYHIKYHE